MRGYTLMRAAQKGLRTLLGSVACVQCLKERARNKEACCLMEGFLLSITDRISSDRFWRVVWTERYALKLHENINDRKKCNPENNTTGW